MLLGLERRIDFLLSSAPYVRILEDKFPQIYTPHGHKIADIDGGSSIMLVHSGTVHDGIKEKFAAIADEMFRDKHKPREVHDRITHETTPFILYVIDIDGGVVCGCELSHGTFRDLEEGYFYIYALCTEKNHCSHGLAKALLEKLREFTYNTGIIKWLWLTVDKSKDNGVPPTKLIEIYRHHGYSEFKSTIIFPNNDQLIPMRRRASVRRV